MSDVMVCAMRMASDEVILPGFPDLFLILCQIYTRQGSDWKKTIQK